MHLVLMLSSAAGHLFARLRARAKGQNYNYHSKSLQNKYIAVKLLCIVFVSKINFGIY